MIGIWYAYNQYQISIFWNECHPFIDLLQPNQNGIRPDPGGIVTIIHSVPGETVYTEGTTWPYDHCFDPSFCGDFALTYSGESETCEYCPSIGSHVISVPCLGGGDCCEKFTVTISGPDEIPCDGDCVTLTVTTTNYDNPDFEWSTGETGNQIEVCDPGEYSVIVMETINEDCMCMHATSFYLAPPDELEFSCPELSCLSN